jgi:hypothetical protein
MTNFADIADFVGAIMASFVSLALFAFACWCTFHEIRQLACWPKVPGRILRYWIKRNDARPHGQRFFHPVIRFTVVGGVTVTTLTDSGYWRRRWRLGHVVYVRYNPTNPKWAELRTPTGTLGTTVGFFAASGVAAYMAWLAGHGWPN